MRLLKLSKLLAPIGLAIFALSMNPDDSQGQGPGGRDGKRGRDGGAGGGGGGMGGYGGGMGGGTGGGGMGGGDGGRRGGMGGGSGGMGMGGGGMGGMGGGGMGGGRGNFDPNTMADFSFANLQSSYGGSGDSLDYSRIPAQTREATNARIAQRGGDPLPTSGTITKDQYRGQFAKRMEAATAMRSQGGPTGPGGSNGDSSGGGRGGFGGGDPSQMTDDQLRERMKMRGADQTGRINLQTAQSQEMARFDANGDGYIDVTEYRAYVGYRMAGGGRGDQNGQGWNRDQQGRDQQPQGWNQQSWGFGGEGRSTPQEEPKPVVLRYGKLPKDLPGWFKELDTNEDGQVGLYEWRNGSRSLDEFTAMDLNGDGLLTAEEYLRYKNPNFTLASLQKGNDNRGDRGDRGDRDRDGERTADRSDRGPGGERGPGGRGGDRSGDKSASSGEQKPKTNWMSLFSSGGDSSKDKDKDKAAPSRGEAAAASKESRKDKGASGSGPGRTNAGGGPSGRGGK